MGNPAGWYRDPSSAAQARYWDGRQWTGKTHPFDPRGMPGPSATSQRTPPNPQAPKAKEKPKVIGWEDRLNKPKACAYPIGLGIVFQLIGTLMLALMLPETFRPYSGSGATVGVFIGAIVLLIGSIAMLVGIRRAASGLDYLVSVAPDRQVRHVAEGAASSGDASNVRS
jgi:hypothetical protein